jgi:hypothetical protein
MRRRLFNAAALVSLLLYALTMAAFVRSLRRSDQLQWFRHASDDRFDYRWYLLVISGRGGVELAYDAEVLEPIDPRYWAAHGDWVWRGWSVGPPQYPRPAFGSRQRATYGFWFEWSNTPGTIRREIILPYWLLLVATAAPPLTWLVRRRRQRLRRQRAVAGLCTTCGYDLRASTETCPECGARISAAPAS